MSPFRIRSLVALSVAALLLAGCSAETDSALGGASSVAQPTTIPSATRTEDRVENESIELPVGPRVSAPASTEGSTPEPSPTRTGDDAADDDASAEGENTDDEEEGTELEPDCAGQDLVIESMNDFVLSSGTCGTVTVTTTGAILRFEGAERLIIVGDSNVINAENISTVEVQGSSNIVNIQQVGDLSITGNANILTVPTKKGKVKDRGAANVVN